MHGALTDPELAASRRLMQRGAAHHPITWGVTLVFLALIDVGVTHSLLLWGPTAFEDTRDMSRVVFAQTYQAARKLYAPDAAVRTPVALLGNSRIFLSARESFVQPELARLPAARDASVVNLGIFGAGLGDQETLVRHLGRLHPELVVLTMGTSDLLGTAASPLAGEPARLLRVGWASGVEPRDTPVERVDRWIRTLWPLYRFREFARAALEDRLARRPDPGPFPEHFASTRALFDYIHGSKGERVEVAYRAWRAAPAFAAFVDYLKIGSDGYLELARQRAAGPVLTEQSPGARVLDAVLTGLAGGPWTTIVFLMPENPLIELDATGEYHRPGFSAEAAAIVTRVAERHQVRVVDARAWMPAEAFIDFDHLMPDLSGFQRPFAEEIAAALHA